MEILTRGDRILIDGRFESGAILTRVRSGTGEIEAGTQPAGPHLLLDARGLLVLPGIIDIHGDAFERHLEPRPRVRIDTVTALRETDRQLVANGITTAYHGVTWSWEPGLRGAGMAHDLLTKLEWLRPELAADTRFHLRHETFNLDAEPQIIAWLGAGQVGCLAFNDHMSGTIKDRHRPGKLAKMVERSGLSALEFDALIETTYAWRAKVPASIARLAEAARAARTPMLSHDDMSAQQRLWFRNLGVEISEFPTTEAAAEAARAADEATVFGAPNVLRGGSHTGCPAASEMVARGLCSILASDYYYPALLLAPFELARLGVCSLEKAWTLVSHNPARALNLVDRGSITPGLRADLILVGASAGQQSRIVATIANGRLCYLADGARVAAR